MSVIPFIIVFSVIQSICRSDNLKNHDLVWLPNEKVPRIRLKNAAKKDTLMPLIGAGTASITRGQEVGWTDETAEKYITQFISAGVRRVDGANMYPAQKGVGNAINNAINSGLVTRKQMFIVSKVDSCAPYPMGYNDTLQQTDDVLKTLNLTYLDLLLIHLPDPTYNSQPSTDINCKLNCTYNVNGCVTPTPINPPLCRQSTWNAMIKIFEQGKALAIGVSNFVQHHIQDIINMHNDSIYYPSVVQNEYHMYYHDDKTREWCQAQNMTYNGWAPLGDPLWSPEEKGLPYTSLNHPVILNIAKKYNVSAAQINLKWSLQHNIPVNPLSSVQQHMNQDLDLFSFGDLTQTELDQISSIQPDASNTSYCVWNGDRPWP
eukprot:331728_1